MKSILAFLVITLLISNFTIKAQTNYDTLTNKTIISLTEIGLPPATIISKIKSSFTSFDVSIDALMILQENKVNGEVINEMIKIDAIANSSGARQINSNDPNSMQNPGIYYFDNTKSKNKLLRVDPSVISNQQSGGSVYNGIGSAASISELSGGTSQMQIETALPTFYFYFENNANPNADNWFFSTATSPKEFVLVELRTKKRSRFLKTGSTLVIYGSSQTKTGVPDRDKIDFDYTEVSEGIFKVTFKKPMEPGEYCFMYASQTPSRYNNNKLFDFGIQMTTKKKSSNEQNRNEQNQPNKDVVHEPVIIENVKPTSQNNPKPVEAKNEQEQTAPQNIIESIETENEQEQTVPQNNSKPASSQVHTETKALPKTTELTKQAHNNAPKSASDKLKEIREFKKLLDEGAITQEEFESEKKKILSGNN